MAVFTLGSVNVDHVYAVPHLPAPGETLAARALSTMLGGKGANQSVAAARAGAEVRHIGAVGADGRWAVEELAGFGVDATHVAEVDHPTGHAIISVDPAGENAILLFPGANRAQSGAAIARALAEARAGDSLLLQNETSHQAQAARIARDQGMRVVYSAAPFEVAAVQAVLPQLSLLVVNAVEAAQLRAALGEVTGPDLIVTHGAHGAEWIANSGETVTVPAFPVTPVDTTGAGDCFIGSLVAALDAGAGREEALRYAAAAAALQVTRAGTAQAMPSRDEVLAFLVRA
ncbi:MAG: ribokinase [Paracoccaceae bacterium]